MPNARTMVMDTSRSICYLVIRQRQTGRHDNAVAGVHSDRIDILHAADGQAMIRPVPNHFKLDLFPTADALFNEALANGAQLQAVIDDPPSVRPGSRQYRRRCPPR